MNDSSLALCIPAYNAATYLPRLLKSALAQTISFNEIWVYDDCSSDKTSEIAREFGAQVIRGEVNRGCSYGKNVLAERTSCQWIHFHDADDALYPNFVEQCRKWMKLENAPDVVLFDYETRQDETEQLINIRKFDDFKLQQDAISYSITEQINPFCGLYKRNSFLKAGGYDLDPDVLYNEDVAMHCRLARRGLSFRSDSTVTVINYHRHNSMSSANQVKCARAQFHVMRKAADELSEKYWREISNRLWKIAGVSAAYLDWKNADACISVAIKLTQKKHLADSKLSNLIFKINPYIGIRIREWLIRLIKPKLRLGYPKSNLLV